jgi:hypothetical protein
MYLINNAVRHDGLILPEVVERILTSMQQIVYQGIETPLRETLWQLSDYMTNRVPNVVSLREIHFNMTQRMNIDFPFARRW